MLGLMEVHDAPLTEIAKPVPSPRLLIWQHKRCCNDRFNPPPVADNEKFLGSAHFGGFAGIVTPGAVVKFAHTLDRR